MNIYFLDDYSIENKKFCNEYANRVDEEAKLKGTRSDIIVKIDDKYYNIDAYSFDRFQEDVFYSFEKDGYYILGSNIILVKDVSKENIILTLNKLYKYEQYFNIAYHENEEQLNKFLESINYPSIATYF